MAAMSQTSCMRRTDPLDSTSVLIRALNQCKRGLTAAIMVSLAVLVGLLAYVISDWAISAVIVDPLLKAVLTLGPGLAAFCWLLGDRETLQKFGEIADIPDDSE